MPTALALSPHLDDAAFSCGGTLARLAASGWRVVVATLFTASVPEPRGFALACQTDKGLGPDVDYMALRRDEDATALRALGAEPVWLPFREAPHRGYGSAPALFAGVREDDQVIDDLAPAVAELLAEHCPDLVLVPQCIGGHADHIQAVHAFDRTGWTGPALWWRDFPYVVRDASPHEPLRERMSARPERDVALTPAEAEAKRRACLAYASQLGFQFGGAEGLDRRLAASGGIESFRLTGALPPDLLKDRDA
jgi:LmbE family N-acetylglucosaminyl deacetylase